MEKKESIYKGYNNIFAERLRHLMEVRKITQQTLSENTNCTRQAIAQYVSGLNAPNVDKLVSIAEYFGVSTDYLLGLSDAETNDKDVQFICDYTGLNERSILTLNKFRNVSNFEFLNYLILSYDFLFGADQYKTFSEESNKMLDCALNDIEHCNTLEEDVKNENDQTILKEYNQALNEYKNTLNEMLDTIDIAELRYYRLVEGFKSCLDSFTSNNHLRISISREKIQELIYELEVNANADNNEA